MKENFVNVRQDKLAFCRVKYRLVAEKKSGPGRIRSRSGETLSDCWHESYIQLDTPGPRAMPKCM